MRHSGPPVVGSLRANAIKLAARSDQPEVLVTFMWIDVTGNQRLEPVQLAQQVLARGYHISRNTAAKLLARAGYRRRSLRKALITGDVDPHERDQQFWLIATRLKEDLVALS